MCYKNMENYNKEIEKNLYLRELLLGNIQGPLTGIPNIDRPWLKYYTKEELNYDSFDRPDIEVYHCADCNHLFE